MTPERWQQVEALYHDARTRPSAERVAFLIAACGGDDDLRREVESLLSQADSSEGLLASPGFGAVARRAAGLPPIGPGRTLGVYRLDALVGVGGMGEVYRARDGKLGRDVAIKVLPHAFTSDPARLARFEREARTLAALNHPNICAIYGFEEAESVRFLILELVDGETLADRLVTARQRPGGPGLSQREALGVARQIARALDFAHERGIVHRDLKPANLKITSDGTVKVLDFGLAKAASGDSAGADLEAIPTATHDGTVEGAIIGTPAYMSPEQARGKPVDKRTDIWAFGCVLFEMLTGRATFAGDTVADTLARVLEREPDWSALPAATPDPIRNLLVGCLAKDARERLRDIGDVRITIDSILSGASGVSSGVKAAPRRRKREMARLPWAVAAALAIVTAWMAIWGLKPAPSPPIVRYTTINLDEGQSLDRSGGAHVISISDDGTLIAYVATPKLFYLRRSQAAAAEPIAGIQKHKGVREPTFSPSHAEVVFYAFADKSLTRMRIADGQTTRIIDADTPTGIDWWSGGILYGQGRKGIMRVSPNGGPKTLVAAVEKDEEAHGPQVLPDGDHFIYTLAKGSARDRWDKASIMVASLSHPNDPPVTLALNGSDARYFSGYLVYAVSGVVRAVPFDPQRREITGDSFEVVTGVSRAAGAVTGAANFSLSNNGMFIYVPGPADAATAPMEISIIDPQGSLTDTSGRAPVKLNLPAAPYDAFRASPNERQLAYGNERDKEWTIWTVPLKGGTPQRLTPQRLTLSHNNRYPAWTSDSKRIAYQSDRGGSAAIWWQLADRSDKPFQLTFPKPGESHIPESWSGTTLLYSITQDNGDASLMTVQVSATGKSAEPQPFGTTISTDPMSAVFAPNGKLVAYTKTERGETTICVERVPSTGRACLTPTGSADSPKHPQWTPGSDRLYYDPRIGDFESVRVETYPVLTPDDPGVKLTGPEPFPYHEFRLGPPGSRTPYDVTRSGKFVGLTTPGKPGFEMQIIVGEIRVINEFLAHLKEKATHLKEKAR